MSRAPQLLDVTFRMDALRLATAIQALDGSAQLVSVSPSPIVPLLGSGTSAAKITRTRTRTRARETSERKTSPEFLLELLADGKAHDFVELSAAMIEKEFAPNTVGVTLNKLVAEGRVLKLGGGKYQLRRELP